MHQGELGETPEEIVEHAGITDRRFRDWRERGLVPRPVARPSRGHARGRAAFYPEGTAELCRAIARKMEDAYRLSDAAWMLWNEGYPLTGYIRKKLLELISEAEAEFQEDMETWNESLAEGEPLPEDHPIYQAQFGQPPEGTGRIRQRLGKGAFSTLMFFCVSALAGQPSEDLGKDPDASGPILKVFGYELETYPEFVRDLITDEEMLDRAPEYFRRYSLPALRRHLEEMTQSELEALRSEMHELHARWTEGSANGQPPPELFADVLKADVLGLNLREFLAHLDEQEDPDAQALLQTLLTNLPLEPEE